MPTAHVVIQARMASTRLPGKVMLPIGSLPSIVHTIFRALAAGYKVILTAPNQKGHNHWLIRVASWSGAHAHCCEEIGESDLLDRYNTVAGLKCFGTADYIVRVTGDCPFIDPDLIRTVTDTTMAGGYEYGDNITFRTYPRGLDVQVYRRDYLQWLHETAETPADREHVLPRIRDQHSRYVHVNPEGNTSQHRWCLDDASDLAFFERIAEHLDCTPPHPTTRELLTFLEAHPEYVHTDYPAAA